MDVTAYAITRTVDLPFDETVERVTAALAIEEFGVLTTIDLRETLKKKLELEIEPYVILAACNPQLASQGLEIEPNLGVLLPCNVVVRRDDERTVVAAMEPLAAMGLAADPALESLAAAARERIERAMATL